MTRIVRVIAARQGPEASQPSRQHERTGRPLADDRFVARLEKTLRRALRR